MVFTSWAFLLFFMAVLVGLAALRGRVPRQRFLLVASCFFYGYSEAWYLLLLATPSLIDYICAIRIEDSDDERTRKRWVRFSVTTNLLLLGYFKYANFFIASIAPLLRLHPRTLNILLPVGISFYTFKTLSYTIDVYRRELPACRSWIQYAMFVTYFPELVAGPIVRASVFLPQMGRSLRPSGKRTAVGLQIVLLGVTKKLLIADRLSTFVDPVFASPALYDRFTLISAIVAYSLQIYCDFSGYSDIAIGISRIIGFDLPENFNMPYVSLSITEFWRRWHITLSSWLRDYLYIPLGGNRGGEWRTNVNLFITMLLGGLWHGASWTFVFWGFLHGIGLAVHKVWSRRVPRSNHPLRIGFGWLATYIFVCVAWVFFRARSFAVALTVLWRVFGAQTDGIHYVFLPLFLLIPLVVVGHLIGVSAARNGNLPWLKPRRVAIPGWARRFYPAGYGPFAIRPHTAGGIYVLLPLPGFAGAFVLTVWVLTVLLFSSLHTSPFIYFQF